MRHIPTESLDLCFARCLHANLEVDGLGHSHLLIKQLSRALSCQIPTPAQSEHWRFHSGLTNQEFNLSRVVEGLGLDECMNKSQVNLLSTVWLGPHLVIGCGV